MAKAKSWDDGLDPLLFEWYCEREDQIQAHWRDTRVVSDAIWDLVRDLGLPKGWEADYAAAYWRKVDGPMEDGHEEAPALETVREVQP